MAASLARLNPSASAHYYAKDNYYTKEQGVELSEWWGKGAAYLNLNGKVDADKFKNLMDGKDPEGQYYLSGVKPRERVNKETGKKELHRSGIDVTFAPPKSVSVAALIDDRKDIENAHKNAVNTTLKEIEKNYSTCRVGGRGNQTNKICGNLIVAKFEHDTSRSKDPQLHTHCVIISAVRKPDGEWRRINNDVYYDNSKSINDLYLKNLRNELEKCNVKIVENPKSKAFEIDGYDNVILKNFSKQTQKIEKMKDTAKFKEAVRSSISNGRDETKVVKFVERKMKMQERDKKGAEQTREQLKENWSTEINSFNNLDLNACNNACNINNQDSKNSEIKENEKTNFETTNLNFLGGVMRLETKEKVIDQELGREYGRDYDTDKHFDKDKDRDNDRDNDRDKGRDNDRDKGRDNGRDNDAVTKEHREERSKKFEIDFNDHER